MVPAGVACTGERGAPEWELESATASSGSSSGTASSGTGGSGGSSSGTGGSGGSSSGTGGSGGTAATCDGTNDCGGCVSCAVDGPCATLWTDCQANVDCRDEALCQQECAVQAVGDVTVFNTCVANTCVVPAGFDQLWPCFCTQTCAADCTASADFHCVTYMPAW
jgi:hypothetical protein